MTEDSKLITTPDFDYTNNFKVLLVDFDRSEVAQVVSAAQRSDHPITIYMYELKDSDIKWCCLVAQMADAILVNVNNRNLELLKGYLLSFKNAKAYGLNDQTIFLDTTEYDLFAWLTKELAKNKNIELVNKSA